MTKAQADLVADDPIEFPQPGMGSLQLYPVGERIVRLSENLNGLFIKRIVNDAAQGLCNRPNPRLQAFDFLAQVSAFPHGPSNCGINIILCHGSLPTIAGGEPQ